MTTMTIRPLHRLWSTAWQTPKMIIDSYDAALFDLDGVIYLGGDGIAGAAECLSVLRQDHIKLGYVTNNAARPPKVVADHLRELGITLDDADVVTSSQAGAQILAGRFGLGAKVLIVGGEGIRAALLEEGLEGVQSADDEPVAVIQGWSPDLTWNQLNEAAIAIQRGAHWLATNTDSTRPTERGIVPGNGAAVDAVQQAVDVRPEVAGKPDRPLIDVALKRLGATRVIFVGDRTDTDVAGAAAAGLDSLMVLTGAHGPADVVSAAPECRPTHLGHSISALLEPVRSIVIDDHTVTCRGFTAAADGGRLTLSATPTSRDQALDALWALAQLSWRSTDAGKSYDPRAALAELGALR